MIIFPCCINLFPSSCSRINEYSRFIFCFLAANVPVDKACGFLYNINLSMRQYEEIRLALLPYDVSFPTKNALVNYKSTLYPEGNDNFYWLKYLNFKKWQC